MNYQMGFRLHRFVKTAKSIDKKAILQQQYLAHISDRDVDISEIKELGEYL
jgi:phage host-nuclease inhibitor protein Gam